jgi:transposase-like protein
MTLGDQYGTECPHCEEPIDMEQREAIREGQRFRCPHCHDEIVVDMITVNYLLARPDEVEDGGPDA